MEVIAHAKPCSFTFCLMIDHPAMRKKVSTFFFSIEMLNIFLKETSQVGKLFI